MSLLHPAKGVDYYGFRTSSAQSLTYSWPTDDGKKSAGTSLPTTNAMWKGNVQLSTENVAGNDAARFQWSTANGSTALISCYADISPITGNMSGNGASVDDLSSMLETPTHFASGCTVCYGFYDASTGDMGLTSQDQSYVYITTDQSNWMGNLGSAARSVPFNHFVLPAAHDSGMYDPTTVNLISANYGLRSLLAACIAAIPVVGDLLGVGFEALPPSQVARELINFAFTQKDNVHDMLRLGIRYFDFRPAYCYSLMKNDYPGLFHQHSFIPGVSYDTFLNDLLTWLGQNPSEIVVLALGHAQLFSDSQLPSQQNLADALSKAQQATGTTSIVVGDKNNLSTSYGDLLSQNCRLLMLNQTDLNYHEATKYDSYSTDYYHTTKSSDIVAALNTMQPSQQNGYDYTVLQLQGTVTGTAAGAEGAATGFSDATSPLLSTKPSFDNATYPWVQGQAGKFEADKLLVLLNDFADNALVSIASTLTAARLPQ